MLLVLGIGLISIRTNQLVIGLIIKVQKRVISLSLLISFRLTITRITDIITVKSVTKPKIHRSCRFRNKDFKKLSRIQNVYMKLSCGWRRTMAGCVRIDMLHGQNRNKGILKNVLCWFLSLGKGCVQSVFVCTSCPRFE